jgi:hypothetical protein
MRGDRLLRLYPRAWRDRYGDEFLALLGDQRLPARSVVDVVAGALDARLARGRSLLAATRSDFEGGAAVLQTLREACQHPNPVSPRDARIGAAVMIGLTAFLTLIGVILDKVGFVPAGQFVILLGFFVAFQVSMLFTYLKEQPARVKAVLAGGPLLLVAIIIGTSMWVASLT